MGVVRYETHPGHLLILSIEESDVAQLKVSLPVLEVAAHHGAVTLLEQPAPMQHKMVDVATIFYTYLHRH